jgi:5-methylcytosine-specific restriction endonuclease McrA
MEPPKLYSPPRVRPDLCLSCGRWDSKMRYRQTEKNRAAQARYNGSKKARATWKRYNQSERYRAWKVLYRRSENGRAAWACWAQTEKGRASLARRRASAKTRARIARYQQTEKGRASLFRHNAFRRARKRKATILQPVDRRAILALDGGVCHLCDLPVDPQVFHLDHIIPLAVEPIHADFNAAIAHPTCNQRKHARVLALSPSARARWQERRPEHLALLDQHLARHAA